MKRIFEIDAQGQKCQNGKVAIFLPNSHFGTFIPVHRFQNFFCQMTFVDYYEKPITQFFSKSASGPVQARPCTHLGG